MAYTYDDFLTKLNQSGLANQFSQADLNTAMQYPEFGMSMISAKQNYANAQTQEGRDTANALAEQLRASYGNYIGGSDGSGYLDMGRTPADYQSKYGDAIDNAIDQLNNYGSFSYGPAPTYTSRYDEQMNSLLNDMINRQPYLYNLETDPVWQAYKKQYTREGQRATADTLGQVATMTGGMPSSYAVNAATQAGDYYMSQMTDMIPQLYQQAYDRYLSEYTLKQNDLAAVQSMEQMDYGKYQDQLSQYNADRNLAYNQWQDEYNMLSNNIGVMQGQDDITYNRYLQDLDWNAQQQAINREQTAAAAQNAAAQVDAMLAAGGVPSAALVAQAGYNQEYIDAMAAYYAKQAALSAAKGSGGGTTYDKDIRGQVDDMLAVGVMPPAEMLAAAGYPYFYAEAMVQAANGGSTGPYDLFNEIYTSGASPEGVFADKYTNADQREQVLESYYAYAQQQDAQKMTQQGAGQRAYNNAAQQERNSAEYNTIVNMMNSSTTPKAAVESRIESALATGKLTEDQANYLLDYLYSTGW